MPDFVFPTSAELRVVEQEKLPRLEQDRPIFRVFPVEPSDDHLLVWEQKDNYTGLQQVRGLGGAFAKVNKVGAKRYQMEPGIYGEQQDLDENELTRRRRLGSFGEPVNVSDLVMDAQDLLLQRRLDRIELIVWTLLATGTFSVSLNGQILHGDTFPIQAANAAVPWGTVATATPIADFRSVQASGPARGANFGAGAEAWMNRATFNKMLSNTNPNDLGGRRAAGLVPINDRENLNRLLNTEDLSTIVVYDEGYFTDGGVFTRYIPNDKVIFVGKRPGGARLGAYRMTRNINNPGMAPGPYSEVIQRREPPKNIGVYDGHNGGPVLFFPGSILVLSVN